ncbi:hypothetical protein Pst134EB_012299 [Puccinia striiformis f. sp. tritici]|nr:hypothetical protein Pst134EB_012299 [Puccinia striiformis f. sp. tritici]
MHPTNAYMLAVREVRGQEFISYSIDVMANEEGGVESDDAVPEEVLNSFTIPGYPRHKQALKVGIPVILLRNMDLKAGLSNGTRLLIVSITSQVLRCIILTGCCVGAEVGIPKFDLKHDADRVHPVSFSRYQFPVAVAFALTVNKAQGQSLDMVSVYLPRPVFGHGQLYVALSRVTSIGGLTLGIDVGEPSVGAVTNNVVNLDMIRRTQSGSNSVAGRLAI